MKVLAIIALICMFVVPAIADDIINPGKTTHEVIQHSKVEGVVGDIEVEIHKSTKVSGEYLDLPDGPAYIESPAPINPEDLPNPDDPTSATTYPFPIEKPNSRKSESPAGELDGRWGDDIMIYDGEVGTGQDFDEDEATGDIYAVFDTYHSTFDSLLVYRSTDGGDTWNFWRASINSDGSVTNPKIRVARDAGGQTWVCMFGIWIEPSGDQILYMRRMKPDQSQSAWESVCDTVVYADVDADIGDGAWVYVTYIPMNSGFDIYAARNYLDGDGWKDDQWLFMNPEIYPYPQIAAGAGGNVAVTFVDDRITTNNEIRIKRSTNYGSTWISSEQVSNNSGAYAISQTDIAYSHGSTQTGWITSSFYVVNNYNLVYHYSTNSGVNWTDGGLIGASSGDENSSSLRCRKATGALTVAYNADPGDSAMFTWTIASNPTNFTTPVRINDHSATGVWPPCAGWITRGGGGYSAIIYSNVGYYNPYFDWFGNPGIEEKPGKEISAGFVKLAPNPSRNFAKLSYMLKKEGNVKISLYDATGRSVDNLVNEAKPAGEHTITIDTKNRTAGIYFLKVKTPEATYTKQMTIVK